MEMALRSEACIILAALLSAATLAAQTAEVRHDHLRKSGTGKLTVSDQGIVWEEGGKKDVHSRAWSWESIQQLELTTGRVRVLTYDDEKWKLGRDREYVFDDVPASFAYSIDPLLRAHLGAKYVAALAQPIEGALWQIPVKLHERLWGSEGTLAFTGDRLIYSSTERGEPRTWTLDDIESVSSGDRYELTVQTLERAGWTRGPREFQFQLKQPIAPEQYQALWKAINRANGLALAEPSGGYHSHKENPQ
jgi:hypothetical protein